MSHSQLFINEEKYLQFLVKKWILLDTHDMYGSYFIVLGNVMLNVKST